MPSRRLASVLWRPFVAVMAMSAVVLLIGHELGPASSFSGALARLVVEVAFGALTYVATVISLWLLSGRPEGAESWILGLLRERLARRRVAM